MGATLVAAVVIGSALYWVSVGDSLLWVCRDGRLHRLNADHSMRPVLQDLVELGRMTEEEAWVIPGQTSCAPYLRRCHPADRHERGWFRA